MGFPGFSVHLPAFGRLPHHFSYRESCRRRVAAPIMTVSSNAPTLDGAKRVLVSQFGLKSLRPPQEAVLRLLLTPPENCPPRALAIFPTGGGKSLCYQLPALLFPSALTVVVSPLLALMKDQVDSLKARGIPAASLHSGQEAAEARGVQKAIRSRDVRILYVSPERFKNTRFLNLLHRTPLALLAIDEAHCVSQWGHSFRPDYLRLAVKAADLPFPRVLALTATATPAVAKGICLALNIPVDTGVVRVPSARPNLTTRIVRIAPSGASTALAASGAKFDRSVLERINVLVQRLRERPPGPTVVYVTLQKTAVNVAEMLVDRGLQARPYHAGLRKDVRAETQHWFLEGTHSPIVVATIAFGMGIDKSDIRYVYHFNLPSSLDAYVQEIGRAGRDGLPSICEMLACADDVPVLEGFARGAMPSLDSVLLVLKKLFANNKKGQIANYSMYHLAHEVDVRDTTLAQLIAQLEISEKYLREITPFFGVIKCRMTPNKNHRRLDSSTPGKRILETGKEGTKLIVVDVEAAAKETGIEIADISGVLENLRVDGYLEDLSSSNVIARVEILKEVSDTQVVARALHTRALVCEKRDLKRITEVLDFISGGACHSQVIARRFGDKVAAEERCGHCEICLHGSAESHEFGQDLKTIEKRPFDEARWMKVMEEVELPREPLVLARFAAGISSPLIQKRKFRQLKTFGSMADTPFPKLLERARLTCK